MKEEYLHYLFKYKILGSDFISHSNLTIKIIDFGEHNQNAGPDFLDAKISYDNKTWIGPIEFHVNASDWYKHKHQNDPAYQNVIAHFVYNNDTIVKINNFALPTVELNHLIDQRHYDKYHDLIKSTNNILCEETIGQVPKHIIEEEKEMRIKQRLWQKSIQIVKDIESNEGDRKKGYLLAVARTFGGKVNQIPFERVVSNLQMKWFAKLNYDSKKVEALVLGVSGLLPQQSEDRYVQGLIHEFQYQKKLFNIDDSVNIGWKYSRMRPSNFPDRRLAQFAAFLNSKNLVSNLLDTSWSHNRFKKESKITLNAFWSNHFRITASTEKRGATGLSNDMLNLILINAVAPFIYAIGLWEGNDDYKKRAKALLKEIKPENNGIIDNWKSAGMAVDSAFDSQSLLELKKQGCNRKKCLFCAIGKSILKR